MFVEILFSPQVFDVVLYLCFVLHTQELQLDILDDITGEAKEIHGHNKWLTYGEPMHRMREFGVTLKEMDLLDEAKLTSDQILAVVRIM